MASAPTGGPSAGLQIIFSFFLGLMVTAFIGVGVYTFYPPPETLLQDQLQQLGRQQEDIQSFKNPNELSPTERAKLREIQDKIRALEDKQQAEREIWGRNTSIVLIIFATLVMSVSLVRADQLPVISNGLLLGGVFTMVYGVGWIIATGTSIARFIVMTIALLITLALGYIRFVRGRRHEAEAVTAQPAAGATAAGPVAVVAAAGPGTVETGGTPLWDLAARVEALEKRVNAAASALTEEPGAAQNGGGSE